MELAASALLLLVLLLPGIIFETTYSTGFWRWNSPTNPQTITERIPFAIVAACLFHAVWLQIAGWFGYTINFDALTMLLLGSYGHDDAHFDETINSLTAFPARIFWYFSSLYLSAATLGLLLHRGVRYFQLDKKTRILRFKNEWFYLLSGEYDELVNENHLQILWQEIKSFFARQKPIVAEAGNVQVWLTTIVNHGGKDYLYRGIVYDFYFDKTGALDKVILIFAHRRLLENDRQPNAVKNEAVDQRYYEIVGDYFVLKYLEMSTINLDYFVVEDDSDADNTISAAASKNA